MATPQIPLDLAGPFPSEEGQNVSMVRALFFSPDSKFLYVHWITGFVSGLRSREQRLAVYETGNWRRANEIVLPPVSLTYGRIHPVISDDRNLYAFVHGISAPNISVVDTRNGSEALRLTDFSYRPQALAFGTGAKTLYVGGASMSGRIPDPKALHEYDVAHGKLLRSIPSGHLWDVETIVHRQDSNLVVTASNDKTMELRNASSGQLLETMGDKTGVLYSIAVRPDGKALVSAGGTFLNVWLLPSP